MYIYMGIVVSLLTALHIRHGRHSHEKTNISSHQRTNSNGWFPAPRILVVLWRVAIFDSATFAQSVVEAGLFGNPHFKKLGIDVVVKAFQASLDKEVLAQVAKELHLCIPHCLIGK